MNNIEEKLLKDLDFLKYRGISLNIFKNIGSPNYIVKEKNSISFYNSYKELRWFLDSLIEKEKSSLLSELLKQKERGIF